MNGNLFSYFQEHIRDAASVALDDTNGRIWTYGDLLSLSGQIANVLVERGVRPGDRVMVQVEKSVMAVCLYLATLRAGAVFLPLNTAYTYFEVEYFVRDAEPALLICDPSHEQALSEIAGRVGARIDTLAADERGSLFEAASAASHAFPTVVRQADDLAAILYTSGTTGRSKGAMLTHANLLSNALTLVEAWKFTERDVLIHALPIYHTHGLFVAVNVSLLSGAAIKFLRKFEPDRIIELMKEATVLMGVPTFYVRLLQSPRLDNALSGMRLFISGSAPLLAETHAEWQFRTGHAILERYGMTETNMNTSNPYDGERVAGTVGPPLPGVSVRITNPDDGAHLGVDEIGMIEVKGPNVFAGYWRLPEKTAAEMRPDGFFITGDLGKIDQCGYVHILGRGKDLVITGGFNVYPKEIEEEIDALPGVIESAIIGVPHPDFGEGVTAVVVRKPGVQIEEEDILTAIHSRLAKFKLPKRIVFIEELPRNTMGKVQKNVLRDNFRDLYLDPSGAQSSSSLHN